MKIVATATISSIVVSGSEKNALKSLKVTALSSDGSATTYDLESGTAKVIPASLDYSWKFTVSVSDQLNTVTKTAYVASEEVIIDIAANGKGLAIGKVCERDGFDARLSWLPDFVVETGTYSMGTTSSGISYGTWTYRKWASGVAECWGSYSDTVTSSNTTNWGAMYTSDAEFAGFGVTLPSGLFVATPVVSATLRYNSGANAWLATRGEGGVATKEKTSAYQLIRPTAFPSTNPTYVLDLRVTGKWK